MVLLEKQCVQNAYDLLGVHPCHVPQDTAESATGHRGNVADIISQVAPRPTTSSELK